MSQIDYAVELFIAHEEIRHLTGEIEHRDNVISDQMNEIRTNITQLRHLDYKWDCARVQRNWAIAVAAVGWTLAAYAGGLLSR